MKTSLTITSRIKLTDLAVVHRYFTSQGVNVGTMAGTTSRAISLLAAFLLEHENQQPFTPAEAYTYVKNGTTFNHCGKYLPKLAPQKATTPLSTLLNLTNLLEEGAKNEK